METNTRRSSVLDFGSRYTKAGFTGEEAPREVFHSCVGVPRNKGLSGTILAHRSDVVGGDEAFADRGLLDLRWAVRRGHVQDVDLLEQLLFYTFYNRLEVVPDSTPCLFLEPTDQTPKGREKVAELLFERFNVPLIGLLNTSTATVYSTGRTTGVAIDSGAGKTMISAVCDGHAMAHSMRPSYIAGDVLTDELFASLQSKGYPLSTEKDWLLVQRVKETMCRASTNLSDDHRLMREMGDVSKLFYTLPDDERLFIFDSEYMVPERLFKPSLVSTTEDLRPATPTGYATSNAACQRPLAGWAETIVEVIDSCPTNVQDSLYGNIVLGGGTTMMTDVDRRLQMEMVRRGGPERVAKCVAFPDRGQAAWVGGSVWGCSASYPSLCLMKADYHDSGPSAVHRYVF